MSSLLTPFKAYIDQSLISNASNFFDNSTTSILRELLQNSRRSGATRVDLRQSDKRWKYSDNGPGCVPTDLLGLGASRWAEGVREAETPAGCGFFSLARRNPTVSCPSMDWKINLTEKHFNGELEIQPEPCFDATELVTADPTIGLVIEFDCSGSEYGLDGIAKYMPIDFYKNGIRQDCQQDFLEKPFGSVAHKIIAFSEHITIRVDLVKGIGGNISACYNGWRVGFPDRDDFTVSTTAGNFTTQAAIMVVREKALPLELPQRNKMVVSDVTKAIRDLVFCTSLELAAANLKDVSLASPSLWLHARARGYTGEVLYPKFFGQLLTRTGAADMQDYSISDDDDGYIYDLTRFVTLDEFEAGDYKCKPDNDVLGLIAQTSIPCVKNGVDSTYDIDLDEYFAPGLRLVRPLKSCAGFGFSIPEGGEGYEWAQRLRRLRARGLAWCDQAMVVAKGVTEDGRPLELEGEPLSRYGFDEDNVYDSIQLEFRSDDDTEEVILPAAALFGLDGDKNDGDIDFIVTKGWFENMPASMPDSLARFAFAVRKCREGCDEDAVTVDKMAEKLRKKFAKFSGIDDFYKQRFVDAAIAGVEGGLYHLDQKPGCVVLTLPVSSSGRYVCTGLATCELVPPFVPLYTFEGSHGITACDAQGRRDPHEANVPGTDKPPYPEYHSFDVPTMERLGIRPGVVDILDACGWHDSTKKIYVTPGLPHVLWTVGLLIDPSLAPESPEVRAALIAAFEKELISSDLYSAMWYEYRAIVKSLVGDAMSYLPPIRKLWFYSSAL